MTTSAPSRWGRTATALFVYLNLLATSMAATGCGEEQASLGLEQSIESEVASGESEPASSRLVEPASDGVLMDPRYVRIGGVSKRRIVTPPGQPSIYEIETQAAGTLYLAATLLTGSEISQGEVARCRVHLDDGTTSRVIATLELQAGQNRWSDRTVELPAHLPSRLTFACLDGAARQIDAIWSRPLFVPRASSDDAPAVVLISIDTLRADRVSGFGGSPQITPALGRLGREGQRFIATTSESTWTLPSHFSILYSRLYESRPLEEKPIGLAQALSEQGFVTVGLTGGGYISADFNFQDGFDHYAEYLPSLDHQDDIDVLPDLLEDGRNWLDRFDSVPLFLFLHTYAVHQLTDGEIQWQHEVGYLSEIELSESAFDLTRSFYDQLVSRTDAAFEPFFEDLRRLADRRPVTLVVVSDHGEAFGEHNNFRHGRTGYQVTLHDEVIRVPLIVWGPGHIAGGKTFDRPTMLSDIAPSILEILGLPIPSTMQGESLRSWWTDGVPRSERGRGSISRFDSGWSLREAERKLIVSRDSSGAERVELYAIARDPDEQINLAIDAPNDVLPIKNRLMTRLFELGVLPDTGASLFPGCVSCDPSRNTSNANPDDRGNPESNAEHDIDEATRERLKALGYNYLNGQHPAN